MSASTGSKGSPRDAVTGCTTGPPCHRDHVGWLLFALSAAGLPLVCLALRRLGRLGGILVVAGCGVLFLRDAGMVAGGAPGRLRLVPRLLLFFELALNGIAILASFATLVRGSVLRANCHVSGAKESEHPGVRESGTKAPRPSPPWARYIIAVAAGLALLVHTVRMAIYLSPSRGRRAAGSAAHTFEH